MREAAIFPLNLPNALTLVRILLVPVLLVALTLESLGGSTIAAVVFAIAALTDGLDGYIGRSRQTVTNFGKVMDPVADKLMIAAAADRAGEPRPPRRLGGHGDHRAGVRGQRATHTRRPAGGGHTGQPARQAQDDRAGGGCPRAHPAPDHRAVWVRTLVYAMVGVTVLSGADSFLHFRRKLEESSPRPEAPG